MNISNTAEAGTTTRTTTVTVETDRCVRDTDDNNGDVVASDDGVEEDAYDDLDEDDGKNDTENEGNDGTPQAQCQPHQQMATQ